VSVPLRWQELADGLDPRDFSMAVALRRVETDGDLFEPVLAGGQTLNDATATLAKLTG
jgi:bifunctional non-homologous end joining protein LigD